MLPFRFRQAWQLVGAMVILSPASRAVSAQSGAFGGQLVDASTAVPLSHLKVLLIDNEQRIVGSTLTDERGLFVIPHSKAGIFHLCFNRASMTPLFGPIDTVAADSVLQRQYKLAFEPAAVDSPLPDVKLVPATIASGYQQLPVYPHELERSKLGGTVLLRFVVDTTGRADVRSVRQLNKSDDRFYRAVIRVLPLMHFTPATINGHKIRSSIEMTFSFAAPT